eukprot:EC788828.1.p5 GENE.EC788828.1~~EC788828.1.p5  ORF type:complete len:65 (-),score=18.49 EC788828.1:245-439(-)
MVSITMLPLNSSGDSMCPRAASITDAHVLVEPGDHETKVELPLLNGHIHQLDVLHEMKVVHLLP